MPGDILIVDSVSTNRIMLKVKLLAAQHRVRPCETAQSALAEIEAATPDLVMIDLGVPDAGALSLCQKLKSNPETKAIPIVATGGFLDPSDRVRALKAGADDVIGRPYSDQILQARLRSLLRARDASHELELRDGTRQALGFAEGQGSFLSASRINILTECDADSADILDGLTGLPNVRLHLTEMSHKALPEDGDGDLVVIDARHMEGAESRLYQILSEVRARKSTRHSAILIVMPHASSDIAAMALDLGANDVVSGNAAPEEIMIRARNLLSEKQRADQLRATVKSGLEAAVTDPLTGLYNRRYAMPHLTRMAERAHETGLRFAVMVIDIDHFKGLNDRYGHAAGDEVLRQVAERLRSNLRAVDLVARIGGEEFLVAVPDSDAVHARVAAERLCSIVNGAPFFVGRDQLELTVTVSIGVGLSGVMHKTGDSELSALIDAADAALYAAKGAGRNTVSLSAA